MKIALLAVSVLTLLGVDAYAQPVSTKLALDPATLNFAKAFHAKSLVTAEVKNDLPSPVILQSELSDLFDGNGCSLPPKLRKALKDETGRESLIPKDLTDLLGNAVLSAPLQKYPNKTANAVLHSVTIPGAGASRQLSLVGAESYRKRSAGDFLDPEASDFAFTMDCSGYLNAALRTDVSIPTSQIIQASDGALKSSRAMLVMRGHVFSPPAAAMDPSLGGAGLSERERIDLLYAIVAEVISDGISRNAPATDATPITAWRKIDVIWTSNQGESSLTGKASIAGSGNVGVGLASVSASLGAGGAVSRQVRFTSFNTYILDTKILEPVQRTLGVLKSLLKDEVQRMRPGPTSTVNSNIEVLYPTMPERACKLDWKASTPINAAPGSLTTTWSDEGCKITFTKAQGLAEKSVLDLKAAVFGIDLAFPLPLP
jgi:hypothetical protein